MINRSCQKENFLGFTLLELLVVMAIIALAATIAITALSSAKRSSRDTQRMANIAQISKAMVLYYNEYVIYPNANCPGAAAVSACTGTGNTGLGDYLKTIATINDPTAVTTDLCTSTGPPPTQSLCNYSLTVPNPPPSDYTVYFYLENALKATGSQCNKLKPSGVTACP